MLGSHQYDSIRTAYTVYGSCGSVLQYGETFDIGGVDAVQVTGLYGDNTGYTTTEHIS